MQLLLATRDSGYLYAHSDKTHDCWRYDLGNVGTSKVTKHSFAFNYLKNCTTYGLMKHKICASFFPTTFGPVLFTPKYRVS